MHDDPLVRSHLEESITKEVNPLMARVEHIRNFVVLPREFSTDTGELTPTFKVKRNVVSEMYADEIDQTYAAGQLL
jgi:long-chain acyl-CoA synthetase